MLEKVSFLSFPEPEKGLDAKQFFCYLPFINFIIYIVHER